MSVVALGDDGLVGLIGSDGRGSPESVALSHTILDGRKILIVTPVDGAQGTAMASWDLVQVIGSLLAFSENMRAMPPARIAYPSDLVRSRSKAVRVARDAGFTDILWLDNDNIPKTGFLGAMLQSGFDWVGCPYPRKKVHFERMHHVMPEEQSEWYAYNYAYHLGKPSEDVQIANGCMPVDRLAIGCTLTSLRALNAMWDYFIDDDWYTDVEEGGGLHETVALFGLLYSQTSVRDNGMRFRALYSEDYSACERYNIVREARPDLNFAPIQMLVSHPADHVGMHRFQGSAEGIHFAR